MKLKEITYKDRSEFLRGFATIIRKNNYRHPDEKTMFLTIGNYFGFEEEFCRESLEKLMVNKYISEHPAVFSNIAAAEFFINDVTKIMSQIYSKPKVDEPSAQMSDAAKEWLRKTAEANKVNFSFKELIGK